MIIVLCQVFEMNPYLWVGLPGLAADIQTVRQYSNLSHFAISESKSR